jgi:enoyl-CoA hydratase
MCASPIKGIGRVLTSMQPVTQLIGLPATAIADAQYEAARFHCGDLNVENQNSPICNDIGRHTRRRVIVTATAAFGGQLIDVRLNAAHSQEEKMGDARMLDIPLSPDTKVAVERRGQIVLIGINRPQMFNRIDLETFYGLAKAYYDFDNDPTLWAAVLIGHGEQFSRGNDVDAFSALAKSGKAFTLGAGQIDPLGRAQKLSKPLVAVTHGDTWNMGHELHLNADIRVASADVQYRQTENAYGRVPGVAPVRWPREVGWANTMRYLLTGDPWDAQTAYRMGVVQEIAPNKAAALEVAIDIANRIAACGPLGIKATLQAAHLVINDSADTAAYAKLQAAYVSLFHSEDFIEGRKAEAENRPPIFEGR